jgi:hypothetical protein
MNAEVKKGRAAVICCRTTTTTNQILELNQIAAMEIPILTIAVL